MNATALDLSQVRTDALNKASAFRRLIDVDPVRGRGHLYHFFERQYNAATRRVSSGKSRVSVCTFGDSIAIRTFGWLSILMREDFPNNTGKGFGNVTNPLSGAPNDNHPPSGHNGVPNELAERVTGRFDLWLDGSAYELAPDGTVTFPPREVSTSSLYVDDNRPFTTIKVAYVRRSSGGSFDIETSPDGVTWTKQGATIDTSNATTVGAVAVRTVAQGVYHVRVKNVLSGMVVVIAPYTGWADTVPGFDGMDISVGGSDPSQWVQTPMAIVEPIMASFDPALITVHCAETVANYEAHFDAVIARLRAGNPNRSILWATPHSYADEGADEATASIQKFLRDRVDSHKIAVFDVRELTGDWDNIVALGWQGDGVHMDQLLYAYCYGLFEQSFPATHFLSKRFDPSVINNLKQLFATQNKPFGVVSLASITEPGVDYISGGAGTPNGEQGTVMSFGIGPEATHPFALFAVQLFVPAYSANGHLWKRQRNSGTWSAWDRVGMGEVDFGPTPYAVNGKEPIVALIPTRDDAGNGTDTLNNLMRTGSGSGEIDGATVVADTSSGGKRALAFNGSSDVVNCGSIPQMNGATRFTMSGWIFRASTGETVGFGGAAGTTGGSGSRLSLIWFSDGNLYCQYGVNMPSYSFGSLTGTGWRHVVVVFDGTLSGDANRLKVYVNGVVLSQAYAGTVPAALGTVTPNFCLGKDSSDRFCGGRIDDVRLWNLALVEPDVEYLFDGNNGRGKLDVFSQYLALSGGTLTGPLALTNTTGSGSSSTGALVVAGGLGVGNNVQCGAAVRARQFTIWETTNTYGWDGGPLLRNNSGVIEARNSANTANAGFGCSQITASGGVVAADLANNAFDVVINNQGLFIAANKALRWSSAGNAASGVYDCQVSRQSAGVLQIGTTANNAAGSLALTNLNATGTVTATEFRTPWDNTSRFYGKSQSDFGGYSLGMRLDDSVRRTTIEALSADTSEIYVNVGTVGTPITALRIDTGGNTHVRNLTASGTVAARNVLTIGTAQTASFTAVAGTLHPINLSAVGADLTITMPATPTTGDVVGCYITHTNASFEAVWNRNGNTMRRGTDVSAFPIWQVNEKLVWQWDGSDWVLIEDGRIAQECYGFLNVAISNHYTTGNYTRVPTDTESYDAAQIMTTGATTTQIAPRRFGTYEMQVRAQADAQGLRALRANVAGTPSIINLRTVGTGGDDGIMVGTFSGRTNADAVWFADYYQETGASRSAIGVGSGDARNMLFFRELL